MEGGGGGGGVGYHDVFNIQNWHRPNCGIQGDLFTYHWQLHNAVPFEK